jgi:hypothetical protein
MNSENINEYIHDSVDRFGCSSVRRWRRLLLAPGPTDVFPKVEKSEFSRRLWRDESTPPAAEGRELKTPGLLVAIVP